PQYIPARLIRQVDIQYDEVKIFHTQVGERAMHIGCHSHRMAPCTQIASNDVTKNIIIFHQENLCSRHGIRLLFSFQERACSQNSSTPIIALTVSRWSQKIEEVSQCFLKMSAAAPGPCYSSALKR